MSFTETRRVHGRYYLIHKPDTDPEVLEQADQCIQDVLDGTAEENHSGYSRWLFGIKTEHPFFPASCWSGTCPNCH